MKTYVFLFVFFLTAVDASELSFQTCGQLYTAAAKERSEKYPFWNTLGLLPNPYRRVSKLIAQSYNEKGALLSKVSRRIARRVPDISIRQVAQKIRYSDVDGSLCTNDKLTGIRGIQDILVYKFETEGQFGLPLPPSQISYNDGDPP